MTANSQIKLIHVACRDLGLDEDTRRDLQLFVTGKDSLKAMVVGCIGGAVFGLFQVRR